MQRSLGLQRTGASSSAAASRPRNNSVALTCPFTTRSVHAAAGISTARRSRDVASHATSVEKSAPSGVTTPASGTATTKRATPSAPVFLAGADGFMGIRVLRELLLAGAKVTAGVQDAEQAAAVRDFMGRYELVTKASLANLTLVEQGDLDDKQTLSKLPKRAKFLYIDGDQSASGRPQDPRALAAVLDAASSSGASQIVVLSLSGGGGGGGGFGLFGKAGGSTPGARRTRVEEQVAESGVPFIALRASVGSDSPDEELGALTRGVRLGAAGTLGGAQRTSRQQVASVVSELLRQPETNGLLLELASDAEASPAGLDAVVSRAVSEARASQPEEEAAPVVAKGAAAKDGTMSLRQKAVAAVAPKGRQAAKEEDEEEEEEEEEKKPFGLFGGLAPKRRAPVKEEEEEEEEEEEGAKAAPLGLLGGLFGGKAAQDSNSVKVKAGSSPSVKVKAGSSPSSGAAERAAAAKDAAAARAAERERAVAERAEAAKAAREEAAERAAAAREAAAERAAAAKAAREEAAERAAAAREAAAEKAAAARAAAAKRPAARGRGREEEEEEEEPKKGGGLFGFLFGGGAKDDDEEEEAPRSGTGKVRGSAKVAVGASKPGSAKVAAQRPGSAKVAAAAPKPGSAKVAVQRPGSSKVKAAPAPAPPQSRGAVGFPTARGAVSKKK